MLLQLARTLCCSRPAINPPQTATPFWRLIVTYVGRNPVKNSTF
jgi:hypothetical protein